MNHARRLSFLLAGVMVLHLTLSNKAWAETARDFPYEIDWTLDAGLLSMGALSFGFSEHLADTMPAPAAQDIAALDRRDVNRFDRPAIGNWSTAADTASYVTRYAAAIGAPAAAIGPWLASGDLKKSVVLAVMYVEALLLNSAITGVVKFAVRRERPYLYGTALTLNEKLEKGADGWRSFFSGHTSSAFCSALFVSTVYGHLYASSKVKYAVFGAALLLAASTGLLRYAAGRHFPTDILVGAAVGGAIGYLIPTLHRRGVSIFATISSIRETAQGIGVAWSF